MASKIKRRVGIVGYGHLGQYLSKCVQESDDLELAFVWNRTINLVKQDFPPEIVLENLEQFSARHADLIVEVAHPSITIQYGESFLEHADYMVGSPTALADQRVEDRLRKCCSGHGVYVPAGAFWGGEDIRRMADRGTLKGLCVTMRKHPDSLKLEGSLQEKKKTVKNEPVVLYDGSVRGLCPMAPNNVNTMAAAAIAAHNLGFDGVTGRLVADPSLLEYHVVEVDVTGPTSSEGQVFTVHTERSNPATVGAVTGQQTYSSFYCSLRDAQGRGSGIHLV